MELMVRLGTISAAVLAISALASSAAGLQTALGRSLAWQIALERHAFSPGIIDAKIGTKTRLATREFQRVRGLPQTGELDPATAAALRVAPESATSLYTLSASDAAEVVPTPKAWTDKAKAKYLGHDSLADAVAERFHCSRALLALLNPGRDLAGLKVGDRVVVPAIGPGDIPRGQALQINLTEKVIRVIGTDGQLVAMFHCSIAADARKRPKGSTTVVAIATNPTYSFDPKMWPEVKNVDRKLLIPPGPRNPVGRCWMSLGLPGYGIHGTPNPELIGKTGSHGCFRLTSWDALRLAQMIRPGTRVTFEP